MKITVWFTNGEVRTFPKVNEKSIKEQGDALLFEFGEHVHTAKIIYRNMYFFEIAEDDE